MRDPEVWTQTDKEGYFKGGLQWRYDSTGLGAEWLEPKVYEWRALNPQLQNFHSMWHLNDGISGDLVRKLS